MFNKVLTSSFWFETRVHQ